jgi:hypothetical protein
MRITNRKEWVGMICVVAHKQASYLWLRSKLQKGRLGGYSCVLGEQKMHERLHRDFCVSHPIESDMRNGQLFKKEYSMTRAPKSWAERAYRKLIYFKEVDKGGHFAAWEQPELFSEEVCAGFRSLRSFLRGRRAQTCAPSSHRACGNINLESNRSVKSWGSSPTVREGSD